MNSTSSRTSKRYGVVLAMLVSLVLVLAFLSINYGSATIPFGELIKILLNQGKGTTNYDIVWQVRLPRLVACMVLGGALALSGFLLQTFFHNPIAGPYILGISSGAKLVVAGMMILLIGRYRTVSSAALIGGAFVGAMLSMALVLLVARTLKGHSMLIISGIMIGYICSAMTDFMINFASDAGIVNLHNWARGSFSSIAWEDVGVMIAVVLPTLLLVFMLAKPIGAYQLGENYALSMGLQIKAFRRKLVLLSSILCGAVIAFVGPISFVGIAVPHLAKGMLKTSKPLIVMPVCFLGGGVFCMGCDLIARTAFAPTELGISSVTALLGAPVVIAMMVKKKMNK